MKILGIKYTHDGAVAMIDGDKLVFSVEAEKIANNPRYSEIASHKMVDEIVSSFGYSVDEMDAIAVDGWKGGKVLRPSEIPVAPYHDFDGGSMDLNHRYQFYADGLFPGQFHYSSYTHVSGHILGAYCMSPFAGEEAFALIWDGGVNARVYRVDADGTITFIDAAHEIYGVIYGIMGYYFGPYENKSVWEDPLEPGHTLYGGYDKPGKLMSYIGFGEIDESIINDLFDFYFSIERSTIRKPLTIRHSYALSRNGHLEHMLMRHIAKRFSDRNPATVLRSVHAFLERLVVGRLRSLVPKGSNLIFSGGSALNIKWNSALRRTKWFAEVFVPPCPNDSGSAIGAACCEMVRRGNTKLRWSVYSGPEIIYNPTSDGWSPAKMSPREVGRFIAANPSIPVVFLHGRAEIGPRSLGHRSIFMSATLPENKASLNKIKKREEFRPIAPICLQEHAQTLFNPGTRDPYMLFDHELTRYCDVNYPAIKHADGTARIQTVTPADCLVVREVILGSLVEYASPILCNTSANGNGSGFFPDVRSAQDWAATVGVEYVWSNNIMWRHK